MKKFRKLFLLIFSIGWLFPCFLAFYFLFNWLELDVSSAIYKNNSQFGSFPSLYYSKMFFLITFFWMSAAFIYMLFHILYKKDN
jgi:hypothetical protein